MKALALGIALIGVFAFAQADLRSEIVSADKAVSNAMMKKDMATLEKALRGAITPDFKYYETPKLPAQTFDQMWANMKAGMGSMNKIKTATTKVLSVKEKGNAGTANIEHTMIGSFVGPDKKTHTMGFSGVSTDTYVKVNGKWKMSKMVWISQKMTQDGKPMPGMGGH